jgi:hypothetical protein
MSTNKPTAKEAERNRATILNLLKLPENRLCAECGAKGESLPPCRARGTNSRVIAVAELFRARVPWRQLRRRAALSRVLHLMLLRSCSLRAACPASLPPASGAENCRRSICRNRRSAALRQRRHAPLRPAAVF